MRHCMMVATYLATTRRCSAKQALTWCVVGGQEAPQLHNSGSQPNIGAAAAGLSRCPSCGAWLLQLSRRVGLRPSRRQRVRGEASVHGRARGGAGLRRKGAARASGATLSLDSANCSTSHTGLVRVVRRRWSKRQQRTMPLSVLATCFGMPRR